MAIKFRTMETRANSYVSTLNPDVDKYEIALEDLEFAFSKNELRYIQKQHNKGVWITDIAKNIRRDDYEILIAIMHMLRKGRRIKPLNIKGDSKNEYK